MRSQCLRDLSFGLMDRQRPRRVPMLGTPHEHREHPSDVLVRRFAEGRVSHPDGLIKKFFIVHASLLTGLGYPSIRTTRIRPAALHCRTAAARTPCQQLAANDIDF